jgi:hypothetical protein
MVANCLVKLLGSAPASVVARGGIISIGYDLKGNCGGVSKPKPHAFDWP